MGDPNTTVFISYRRSVSGFIARAVFMDLKAHGVDVFMDVEGIDSGPFPTIILDQIKTRTHFLVILTPGTVERFIDPSDWMRREIEHAVDSDRNIVPIFSGNFNIEDARPYLTGKLEKLILQNGLTLHHEIFEESMDKLRRKFLNKTKAASIVQEPESQQEALNQTTSQFPTIISTRRSMARGFRRIGGQFRSSLNTISQAVSDFPLSLSSFFWGLLGTAVGLALVIGFFSLLGTLPFLLLISGCVFVLMGVGGLATFDDLVRFGLLNRKIQIYLSSIWLLGILLFLLLALGIFALGNAQKVNLVLVSYLVIMLAPPISGMGAVYALSKRNIHIEKKDTLRAGSFAFLVEISGILLHSGITAGIVSVVNRLTKEYSMDDSLLISFPMVGFFVWAIVGGVIFKVLFRFIKERESVPVQQTVATDRGKQIK